VFKQATLPFPCKDGKYIYYDEGFYPYTTKKNGKYPTSI
jgi:hypothetical protein